MAVHEPLLLAHSASLQQLGPGGAVGFEQLQGWTFGLRHVRQDSNANNGRALSWGGVKAERLGSPGKTRQRGHSRNHAAHRGDVEVKPSRGVPVCRVQTGAGAAVRGHATPGAHGAVAMRKPGASGLGVGCHGHAVHKPGHGRPPVGIAELLKRQSLQGDVEFRGQAPFRRAQGFGAGWRQWLGLSPLRYVVVLGSNDRQAIKVALAHEGQDVGDMGRSKTRGQFDDDGLWGRGIRQQAWALPQFHHQGVLGMQGAPVRWRGRGNHLGDCGFLGWSALAGCFGLLRHERGAEHTGNHQQAGRQDRAP